MRQYAITVKEASVRKIPSDRPFIKENPFIDYYQESRLYTGEAVNVAASAESENSVNGYYYIVSDTCRGWVRQEDIAFTDKWQQGRVMDIKNPLVIKTPFTGFRMGSIFNIINEYEEGYTVNMPVMEHDGILGFKEEFIPKNLNCHRGFMKLNSENLFKTARNMIGVKYSWGDKNPKGYDCSSTIMAVFRVFGMFLPRNSGEQAAYPFRRKTDVSGWSDEKKLSFILSQEMGALIHMDGHVCMYAGTQGKIPMILHNYIKWVDGRAVNRCEITRLPKEYINRIYVINNI